MLTPYAEALVRRGRQLLMEAREAERDLDLISRGERGQLRIGLIANVAFIPGTPLLAMAASIGPRVSVVVADGRALPPDGFFRVVPLARIPIAVFVRPGHPLLVQRSVGLIGALRYPVIGSAASPQMAAKLLELLGTRGHPEEIISLQCDSIDRGLEVARTSDALHTLNIVAAAEPVGRRELVPLPIEGIDSLFGHPAIISFAARTATPLQRAVEALVERHLGTESVLRAKAIVEAAKSAVP